MAGESGSIQQQKLILERFAKERNFANLVYYVDDGYSGTDFQRPGFQQMLADIEAKKVGAVLCKDLSRLGRNSAMVGMYINITFAKYDVRFIAINDNYDSIDPNSIDNDFAGIKNWFNEFYARDTSRKIRAVNKAKGERGEHLSTNPPFGYLKDPENPKQWIVDEKAAEIVKRIFQMCMEGRGPTQIANVLRSEQVPVPTAYKQLEGRCVPGYAPSDPYHWRSSTVVYILEMQEYTGCTVNFKTYTNSMWDKKQRDTPLEDRAVFYNTHPAIIEQEVFDKVQEIRQQRHRRVKSGKDYIFSGLLFCSDCGEKMYFCTASTYKKNKDRFVCSTYSNHSDQCSAHYIRYVVLEDMVWMHMKAVISYVSRYEDHFRSQMSARLQIESEKSTRVQMKQLKQAEKRIKELDQLFKRLYEDSVKGRITEERFLSMSQDYELEQADLKETAAELRRALESNEQQSNNIEAFIERIQKYTNLDELNAYALHELVHAIYIDAPIYCDGQRQQHIHISYDLVGFIPLETLMAAETA